MATFGKSDKNSRDLHIGYGTNYPLELTQPIGPGPGECFSLPNVKHRSSPEYSMRGRPNARLAMDRSPGPAQYAVPQHVLRKGAKKASGPRLGHARRFTAGMLGGADAQLIAHSVGSEQEFDVSSMASLASLESSVGEQSASLASELSLARSLRSAGSNSLYDVRIGMGQQITSRHRSPVGTKFSTSKRPFPGVSPEAASGGGGGGAGAPSPAMGDRQLLSRHPSPKGMVFGSSSRPGPADVRLTREEPGPGAYLRARSISMGRQALSRVRTAPQAKFGTSTRPPLSAARRNF
jgi:hypothetical protein